MFKPFEVQSHKGVYHVYCENQPFESLTSLDLTKTHFIIDENVSRIYRKELTYAFSKNKPLILEANENNKSIEKMSHYISHLVEAQIRKNHTLVAMVKTATPACIKGSIFLLR